MPNVLIVDDDDDIRGEIEREVAADGHSVTGVADGAAALEAVTQEVPDVVVLDLRLPDIDGIEVCRRMRENGLRMPILILTVVEDIVTRVLGFESGADDYVRKPFQTPELLARIRRHAARHLSTSSSQGPLIGDSRFRIDIVGGRVWHDGAEVELTSKEFAILALLVRNAERVVSRERLLEEIWQLRSDVTTRTVDTHIANLRRKLERDPANPERILTAHGRGYRYVANPPEADRFQVGSG